jgi:ribulose-phosphate 3-epimerase
MMRKKYLAPSILSADFLQLGNQINAVEESGADIIHCDVMDGQFVPNITFGPMVVKAVKTITKLPLDVHLMIKTPDAVIEEFADAGAAYITVHQEEVVHLHRTIQRIKSLGIKAGVALNPATPVQTLDNVLEFIDLVLIMSVNPGFGGQEFISSTLKKVVSLCEFRQKYNLEFLIEIDGGINESTISTAITAGVDIFVAGSAIFGQKDIPATTRKYLSLLGRG